jgi:putative addiction module component (TIGR02574 family)
MPKKNATEIEKLSIPEKLALLETICNSLASSQQELPLSLAQKALLKERLEHHRQNPDEGEDWRVVVERLRNRHK